MDADGRSPAQVLDEILVTARLQQALSVAASLGVPDVLADGPRTVAEIAGSIGAHEGALYRLLGTLAAGGILHEDGDRSFRLTGGGRVDAVNVLEHTNRKRIHLACRKCAGAVHFKPFAARAFQQVLTKDAARRITGAEKQDF